MTDAAALRARIDAAPMGMVQTIVIALTFALSALDGFDVLSVAFAAPAITVEWHVGKAALGLVLSAGLAGMAVGAFVLAPLADAVGRRTVILAALALMAAGMAGCASAGSPGLLAAWRVMVGVGIGGCVATINPIAAEFANARRRTLTVAVMAIGYPVGGLFGGLLAAWLLHDFGWRAIFDAGAIAAVILLPLVAVLMPESLGYLLTRRGPGAVGRVNAVLRRCGHAEVAALAIEPVRNRGYVALFASRRATTAWMASIAMLFAAASYYILTWLPQMVAEAGFRPSAASLVSAVASGVGTIAGVALGWLAQRHGLRGLTAAAMIGLGAATVAFGLTPPSLPLLVVAGGACGLCLFSGAAGFYAVVATTFADEVRASASGFVSGMGRVASAVAPLLAGVLFERGVGRGGVSLIFGLMAAAAGTLILVDGGGFVRHDLPAQHVVHGGVGRRGRRDAARPDTARPSSRPLPRR